MNILNYFTNLVFGAVYAQGTPAAGASTVEKVQTELPFRIPTLTAILTFVIRFFFVIAALAALLFLILGAINWVTSAGEKEKVTKAQEKIQAAVVGLVILVAVLALVITLEQVVFKGSVCFGITCDIKTVIPELLTPKAIGTP